MHKIEYVLQRDGEGFLITSYIEAAVKEALPIGLAVEGCSSTTGHADIVEVASLDNQSTVLSEDFSQHYVDILRGQSASWRLVGALVKAGCIVFEYYSPEADRIQNITLDINGARITALNLKLTVPHADQRPATEYHICMESSSSDGDAVIAVRLPYRKQVFMLTSLDPSAISVTEYYDL